MQRLIHMNYAVQWSELCHPLSISHIAAGSSGVYNRKGDTKIVSLSFRKIIQKKKQALLPPPLSLSNEAGEIVT